jgi:hypothetical protein
MVLLSFLSPLAETKELHCDAPLRSRYYKTNYNKTKATLLEFAEQKNWTVRNVDDEHRELFLQGSKFHVIVSMVQVTPYETSVDFKVEFYTLVGFNRPRKMITELYQYLDKQLPFKGVGLHP